MVIFLELLCKIIIFIISSILMDPKHEVIKGLTALYIHNSLLSYNG